MKKLKTRSFRLSNLQEQFWDARPISGRVLNLDLTPHPASHASARSRTLLFAPFFSAALSTVCRVATLRAPLRPPPPPGSTHRNRPGRSRSASVAIFFTFLPPLALPAPLRCFCPPATLRAPTRPKTTRRDCTGTVQRSWPSPPHPTQNLSFFAGVGFGGRLRVARSQSRFHWTRKALEPAALSKAVGRRSPGIV